MKTPQQPNQHEHHMDRGGLEFSERCRQRTGGTSRCPCLGSVICNRSRRLGCCIPLRKQRIRMRQDLLGRDIQISPEIVDTVISMDGRFIHLSSGGLVALNTVASVTPL